MMLVGDSPLSINFSESHCEPELQLFFDARRTLTDTVAYAVAEGHICPCSYFDLGYIKDPGFFRPGEKCVPRFTVRFESSGLKGRRHIKHYKIFRMVLQNAVNIFIANGFCPFIDHCVDLGLFTQRHMSSIHFVLVLKYFYSVYWTKFEPPRFSKKKAAPC
jgi:hypothetical protein